MSNTSATTTTSFINTSDECTVKPPLSSDSSIDSGCSAMTSSDSININQQAGVASRPTNTNCNNNTLLANQRRSDGARINLSMLPPQPLVPPPPPPPQLHELYYDSTNIYEDQASMVQQQSNHVNNSNGLIHTNIYSENFYATYAQSSQLSNNNNISSKDSNQSSQIKQQANASDQTNSSSPNTTVQQQASLKSQRHSSSSLESTSSVPLMPMNVKGMLLHGLPSDEVMRNWLSSIKCDEYIENFIYHGYDIHLVTRMTPQDLAAVGCKSPALRKKLLLEIKKLNLDYEIPHFEPSISIEKWLEMLKLSQYHAVLSAEGYETIDEVYKLTWEDLEEIGITKLGHQKRLLMGVERIQKLTKQREESQNDNAIYDVHPNHRVSLNGSHLDGRTGTLGRVRSGFFQTRSGANLDHRGLPVATVMPAMKHVNSSLIHAESNKVPINHDGLKSNHTHITNNGNNGNNNFISPSNDEQIFDSHANNYGMETLKLNEFTNNSNSSNTISRRNPPPPPPMRTNSLKVFQTNNELNTQSIYGTYGLQNGLSQPTNSTSFLRTPKLGTLTATTNKMLTSGGHIQTIPSGMNSAGRIVPIREAPLPPMQQQQHHHHHQQQQVQLPYQQQNLLQTTIPEKVDEEQAACSTLQQQPTTYPMPLNCDGTSPNFINVIGGQLADANEFPPPPPCQ